MLPSEWPAGFDFWRHALRVYSRSDRRAIEGLASESRDVDWYDVATAAFVAKREKSYPRHPGVGALRRLARRYVRHFRQELIRQHQFLEGGPPGGR
jgi:hypothetical protein